MWIEIVYLSRLFASLQKPISIAERLETKNTGAFLEDETSYAAASMKQPPASLLLCGSD